MSDKNWWEYIGMKFITIKRAKIVVRRIKNLDQGYFFLGVTIMSL